MRVRFKPSLLQRRAIRLQQARLSQAELQLGLVRSSLPPGFEPKVVTGTIQSVHPDRFVMRIQVNSNGAGPQVFAVKVYVDDFGKQVWTLAQALAAIDGPHHEGLCLPLEYVTQERTLVFPWVAGEFLSDIVDESKLDLLRRAAQLAANLHRLPIVPDAPSTPKMLLDDTLGRCDRLRMNHPDAAPVVAPLVEPLREAFAKLDPFDPAPVHGDMAAGQFLWTGKRLVLLDLDMYGYTDPAYDVGHFMGQLTRRCLLDRTLPAHASQWVATFRDAYLAANPQVSPRNIVFYQGMTLIRKIYTLCRLHPEEGPAMVPPLGKRAMEALSEVVAGT